MDHRASFVRFRHTRSENDYKIVVEVGIDTTYTNPQSSRGPVFAHEAYAIGNSLLCRAIVAENYDYSRLCLNPYLSVDTQKYGLLQSMGFGRAHSRPFFLVIQVLYYVLDDDVLTKYNKLR
jgi:hypothetical protein